MQQDPTAESRRRRLVSAIAVFAVGSTIGLAAWVASVPEVAPPAAKPTSFDTGPKPESGEFVRSRKVGLEAPGSGIHPSVSAGRSVAAGLQKARSAGENDAAPPRPLVVARSADRLLPAELVADLEQAVPDAPCRRFDCSDADALAVMRSARADFALLAGALTRNQVQGGLRQATLGVELFAVMVPATSPVQSLSTEQVRRAFAGEVRQWRELGFGGGTIVTVVPREPELARRAAQLFTAGVGFDVRASRASADVREDAPVEGHAGALRIVRVTAAADADAVPGWRALRIADIPATPQAFLAGLYPYGTSLQLVTSGEPQGPARELLAFARSDRGRSLLGRTLAVAF